jgi:AraC-like DNA-binding protein
VNKVKNSVANEIAGNKKSEPAKIPEPGCACDPAELVLDLGGKFQLAYDEVDISSREDGAILIKDKVTGNFYIARGGVTEGPYQAGDKKLAGFEEYDAEGSGTDDWISKFGEYISKSGNRYLIKFAGKSYGPYDQIRSFDVTKSKEKFAATVIETVAVTEDDGERMEEAMKKAKTDQEKMELAMQFSQQMQQSPDLRTSFERLLAHQRLWNPGEGYVLEEDGATARLRYVPWGPSRDGQRQMAEKTAAQFLVMLRLLVGVAPTAIRFAYPERGRANELARGLGIAPGFDAAATEIDFPAEALDGCVADSEPALFRALDRHMARVSSRADVPGSLTARVRAIVVGSLAGGLPSLPALAKRMGCGERTLQRGLAKEGTSLRTLVEEARRRRAESLVATDLTVAELAYQLGYGDAAAVQHALRRWFGANAGELRERERERPSGDRASDRNGEPAS